jgi:hypothetical protein
LRSIVKEKISELRFEKLLRDKIATGERRPATRSQTFLVAVNGIVCALSGVAEVHRFPLPRIYNGSRETSREHDQWRLSMML